MTVVAFGYVDSLRAPAPQTAFAGEFSNQGRLTISHTDGETVPAQDILVRVSDSTGDTTLGTWKTLYGTPTDVSAGNSITLSGFNGDETVYLVWKPLSQDRSQILSRFQTRNIPSPLSSATVSDSTGQFASQRSPPFGSTAWQSLARIGGAIGN